VTGDKRAKKITKEAIDKSDRIQSAVNMKKRKGSESIENSARKGLKQNGCAIESEVNKAGEGEEGNKIEGSKRKRAKLKTTNVEILTESELKKMELELDKQLQLKNLEIEESEKERRHKLERDRSKLEQRLKKSRQRNTTRLLEALRAAGKRLLEEGEV